MGSLTFPKCKECGSTAVICTRTRTSNYIAIGLYEKIGSITLKTDPRREPLEIYSYTCEECGASLTHIYDCCTPNLEG